jgi:exonuclease SbcC
MEITNNRYRLELNEQGEFVICDLYNGGVKRGCNTLSGGETFLTSLSLALALSSQIQLKGSSNMEFFFLDEGFGTLDSNLLDIVMNSLEKLQSENLTDGIISHVEELKNRVPVKLLVEPAQPGIRGTKVELNYS